MRVVLGLISLLCGLALSQQQPCKSPPYLTGDFLAIQQGEVKVWNYEYNAARQRMRVFETEHQSNRSFTYEFLLHFTEGVMYEIDGQTFSCTKKPLRTEYQPIGVPHDASYAKKDVLGSLSVPNAGVTVHAWTGYSWGEEVYIKHVTEEACVPYLTTYYTEKYGEVSFLFLNNIVPAAPQDVLSPPAFCPDVSVKSPARSVDLISLLTKSKARHLTRALSKLKKVYLNDYTELNI